MAQKARYNITLWNGKYGNGARFIVKDNTTGKFTEFSPTRPKDVAWVASDLGTQDEYKGWQDFQNEPVDDLNSIVF